MEKIKFCLFGLPQMINKYLYLKKLVFIAVISLYLPFQTNLSAQMSNVWNYPVRYGTEEWKKLTTFREQLNAYNIPDSLLQVMTTEDLISTCLLYPEWILMTSRNTNQEGYIYLRSLFNGFKELEKRADAGKCLIRIYKDMNTDDVKKYSTLASQGGFIFKLTVLETLISQKSILSNLNKDDLISLFRSSVMVYKQKDQLNEEYSIHSLATTCLVLGRLLDLYDTIQFELMAPLGINKFVEDGAVPGKQLLNQIVTISEKYLNNLDQ